VNPIQECYDMAWNILEQDDTFASLVPASRRVKRMTGYVPELRIPVREGDGPWVALSLNNCVFEQDYASNMNVIRVGIGVQIVMAGEDDRVIADVLWAMLRAFIQARPDSAQGSVRDIKYDGAEIKTTRVGSIYLVTGGIIQAIAEVQRS